MPRTETNPAWYRAMLPQAQAQAVAQRLNISTDQLFNYMAQVGDPSQVQRIAGQGGPTTGGYGGSSTQVDTSQVEKLMKQPAAQPATTAAGAGTGAGAGYFGSDPTINMGSGQIGGAGGTNTMATGQQPESVALGQIAQIDPTSEALRTALAQSYLTPLQTATGPTLPGAPTPGAPSATDVQSYLNLYGQIDPTGLAARQQLETALREQSALGTQLDPETAREVEQQTRLAQTARGNVYGTPQLVEEAMTRGQAGLALQNQRQQALQGFLSSGQDVGSVANALYQQGQQNYLQQYQNYFNAYMANQQNQRAQQGAALSYLTSGATPYQTGASYLANAENRAASAAQGGPVYNPASLGQTYTGAGAGQFPQYGLDMSQNANQWYNSLAAYSQPGYGGSARNPWGSAIGGAVKGALSGALSGAAAGGIGAIPGAILGGAAGGLGGYFG